MAVVFEAQGGESQVETAIAPPPLAAFFAPAVALTETLQAPPLRIWDFGGMMEQRIL